MSDGERCFKQPYKVVLAKLISAPYFAITVSVCGCTCGCVYVFVCIMVCFISRTRVVSGDISCRIRICRICILVYFSAVLYDL